MIQHIGIDLGKNSSAFNVINEEGRIIKELELPTEEKEVREFLEKEPASLCVVEACPLAEWMCKIVKSAGHMIDILDPYDAKKAMPKKKKTDY
jgi:transposase